ncbi:hypothetical protein PCE1_001332 [Barthelona sp. PCE]
MSRLTSSKFTAPRVSAFNEQQVLAYTTRLNDHDTNKRASEGLRHKIEMCESEVDVDCLISVLCRTNVNESSIAARKSVLDLLKYICTLHPSHVTLGHVTQMAGTMKRFALSKDAKFHDEIGATTLGIAMYTFKRVGDPSFLNPIIKTALTLLRNRVRQSQSAGGAMMCNVITGSGAALVENHCPLLIPAILKTLKSESIITNVPFLSVIEALCRTVPDSVASELPTLVEYTLRALESVQWQDRVSACELQIAMVESFDALVGVFKIDVMKRLHKHRFDRIKPVRQAVNNAMLVWNRITASVAPIPHYDPEPQSNTQLRLSHTLTPKTSGSPLKRSILRSTMEIGELASSPFPEKKITATPPSLMDSIALKNLTQTPVTVQREVATTDDSAYRQLKAEFSEFKEQTRRHISAMTDRIESNERQMKEMMDEIKALLVARLPQQHTDRESIYRQPDTVEERVEQQNNLNASMTLARHYMRNNDPNAAFLQVLKDQPDSAVLMLMRDLGAATIPLLVSQTLSLLTERVILMLRGGKNLSFLLTFASQIVEYHHKLPVSLKKELSNTLHQLSLDASPNGLYADRLWHQLTC